MSRHASDDAFHGGDPGSFSLVEHAADTVEQRRDRITRQVRVWSEQSFIAEDEIDGTHPDLSDESALLIAMGYVDEEIRDVLIARRRADRDLPDIGGYAELRSLSDEHARAVARFRAANLSVSRSLLGVRAGELGHLLQLKQNEFVFSDKHFPRNARAVRRDKRDGVYLSVEQREALFDALRRTPAPMAASPDQVEQFTRPLGHAADVLAQISEGTRRFLLGRAAGPRMPTFIPDPGQFTDRYDTLLYLAGSLYDRISNSSAWHSDHFTLQRGQLDLGEELTQIAVDTAALRMIVTELNALDRTSNAAAQDHIQERFEALVPVWEQLVERVAALARIGDLLTQAEYKLRTINTVRRARSLDGKIDDLISRSGLRELSVQNTHEIGDQFVDVDAAMDTYQSIIGGDIAALTSRH
ncbi:hypothetical protein [Lolliginicoccus levis]|uniref:hypothetical protein n=1 Tax=Lolliginicoccus levis TaxID=2919542 RepID=UPI00241D0076|nr:hypothetical protein [Lolliginicoccus levis]